MNLINSLQDIKADHESKYHIFNWSALDFFFFLKESGEVLLLGLHSPELHIVRAVGNDRILHYIPFLHYEK